MTPQEMWNAYKQINPSIGDEIDAWAFGVEPDLLADLVFKGEKTATASAYDLYALEDEPLPQEGTFDVILDSQNQAVCIVEITKVSVQPFYQVSADHAYKEGEGVEEFADYMFSNEADILDANETEGLVQYNVVRDMVNRYISAVRLFDETMAAAEKINSIACFGGEDDGYLPVRFVTVNASNNVVRISRQQYKKALQKYYWRRIFSKLNMEKYATQRLREQINRFVEQQTNVPFTMHNIYQVLNMVIQTTSQRMDKAIEEAFDTICSFSADNSTAGEKWKTNANYMVNKKFIVPYMTSYDTRYPTDYVRLSYSSHEQQIEDVLKALCYITGTDYDKHIGLNRFFNDTCKSIAEITDQRNVSLQVCSNRIEGFRTCSTSRCLSHNRGY